MILIIYIRQKLKNVEEFEEPLKKRYGILPSLRLRRGQGTSSDSEVYNRNKSKLTFSFFYNCICYFNVTEECNGNTAHNYDNNEVICFNNF